MAKVLIVTYYWPPGSGAGVQRWLKFSKYLPSFGWEPVILTVDPQYASYPAIDKTLENDIPEGVRVYKTMATDYFRLYKNDKSKIPSAGFANSEGSGFKSKLLRFIRGNFFIPDPRKGWNKYAFRKACEIIESERIEHVITTSPPHSTQLIGLKLKKKYPSIKWIADLRDPWTDIYYYSMFYHTCLARAIDNRYEKLVLKNADKIITVGKSLKKIFSSAYKDSEKKITVITNGYDEDDFESIQAIDPDEFTISYVGTLSESYPLKGFLKSVTGLQKEGKVIKLRFVGSLSPGRKEMIISETGGKDVEFVEYVDHLMAIRYMKSSSILLLIIPDHYSAKSILTGKLFEYIAAGKPILCIGPKDGDAAEILREYGAGTTTGYTDEKKISDFIKTHYSDNILTNTIIDTYSRRQLTAKLSSALEI